MEKFVLEYALFRMGKHLRMMGYDCISSASMTHDQLMHIAALEGRILICCSLKLLPRLRAVSIHELGIPSTTPRGALHGEVKKSKKPKVVEVYSDDSEGEGERAPAAKLDTIQYVFVNHHKSFKAQMEEVVRKLNLKADVGKIFTRCLKCGTEIEEVAKEAVKDRVHPNVYILYQSFFQCTTCDKVYWGIDSSATHNSPAERHEGNGVESRLNATEVLNYKAMRSLQFMTSYGVYTTAITHYHFFRVLPLVIKVKVFRFVEVLDLCRISLACKACYDLVNSDYLWCALAGEQPSEHGVLQSTFRATDYRDQDLLTPCHWKAEFIRRKKEKMAKCTFEIK